MIDYHQYSVSTAFLNQAPKEIVKINMRWIDNQVKNDKDLVVAKENFNPNEVNIPYQANEKTQNVGQKNDVE